MIIIFVYLLSFAIYHAPGDDNLDACSHKRYHCTVE